VESWRTSGPRSAVAHLLGVFVTVCALTVPAVATASATQASVTGAGVRTYVTGPNAITAENELPGTASWKVTKPANLHEIAGYITRPSVQSGGSLDVHVNAKGAEASSAYTVEVFRMGYYGGAGARLVSGPDSHNAGPALADASQVDTATGRVEANWPVGFTIDTTGFLSGSFLVRLTSTHGFQAYVPFTVRSSAATDFLLLQSHLTWQGYNTEGGNSLYQWNGAYPNLHTVWCFLWWCQWTWNDPVTGQAQYSSTKPAVRPNAYQVGFRRPYAMPGRLGGSFGSGEMLFFELPLIQWVEQQGFNVSYAADFDLNDHTVPTGVKAVILPGHQEYWTGPMRDNAEEAQSRGVGLVSFGANQAYWRCRLEGSTPTDVGAYTCYKSTNGEPHPDDPLKNDPALASAQFRSTFVGRPEQTLLGSMFHGWINSYLPYAGAPGTGTYGYQDMQATSSNDPLLTGTGVQADELYPGLVGGEFDRVWPGYPTIPGTRKIFSERFAPSQWSGGGSALQQWLCSIRWPNACWYGYHDAVLSDKVAGDNVTVSRIFNAGTFTWIWGLTNFTLDSAPPQTFAFVSADIQALTTNILLWAAKIT